MTPPRYYTRRAQLPVGAHAMFRAGQGYYAGPGPTAMPPPAPPRASAKPRSQTPSQAANSQVNAQLAPVLAQQDTANAQQTDAIQKFALALLGKLQPIAGQVGQDYDRAIGQTAQLSGAAANALRNANPNQQDQQLLQAINAPEQQRTQMASQLADTFGGGAAVTMFNQGAVPGGMLAAGKAAAQGQAEQLPGIAALKGQQDLASALYEQHLTREKTLAQRPGLYQNALQTITSNNFDRAKLSQAAKQQAFENIIARGIDPVTGQLTVKAQAELARLQQGDARIAQGNARIQQGNARLKMQQQNAASSQASKDANWALSYARTYGYDPQTGKPTLSARKQAAAVAKQAQTNDAKKHGIPAASYANLKKQGGKAAETFYYGVEPVTRADGSVSKAGQPGIDYQAALNRLMKQYSLTLEDAQGVLNGFYKPGEDGRPFLSLQQRQRLEQRGVPRKWIEQAMWNEQKANDLLKGLV